METSSVPNLVKKVLNLVLFPNFCFVVRFPSTKYFLIKLSSRNYSQYKIWQFLCSHVSMNSWCKFYFIKIACYIVKIISFFSGIKNNPVITSCLVQPIYFWWTKQGVNAGWTHNYASTLR